VPSSHQGLQAAAERADNSGMSSEPQNRPCPGCGANFRPWITTCPHCERGLDALDGPLELKPAPRVRRQPSSSADQSSFHPRSDRRAPNGTNADGTNVDGTDVDAWTDQDEGAIDIPISNAEPVKVALLRTFLGLHGFRFTESARSLAVPVAEGHRLAEVISLWAFNNDMPDDDRHVDTLAATVREIGMTVIAAVATVAPEALPRGVEPASLDLR
jgi:hypothetical protein